VGKKTSRRFGNDILDCENSNPDLLETPHCGRKKKTGDASHLNLCICSLAKFKLPNTSWAQQNPLDGIKSEIDEITTIRPGILSG